MQYKALIAAFFAALVLYIAVFGQSVITGPASKKANLPGGRGLTSPSAGMAKRGGTLDKATVAEWQVADAQHKTTAAAAWVMASPNLQPADADAAQRYTGRLLSCLTVLANMAPDEQKPITDYKNYCIQYMDRN